MRVKLESVALALCIVGSASFALAQNLTELDAQRSQRVAGMLMEKAAEIKSPQVKIETDTAKAVGVRYGRDGVLVVPRKGLDEQKEYPEVRTEQGAGLAYLFLSSAFSPVIDGTRVKPERLRTVNVVDNQGTERAVACLLLAVRQIGEDDWRLYVYGADKKPLIDAPFTEAAAEKPGPIAVHVEQVAGFEGTLTITAFGKYQAGFRIRYELN